MMLQESIEQQKEAEKYQRGLLQTLEDIQLSLRASALFQVVDELYTKDERRQRRNEYFQLQEALKRAQEHVQLATPDDGLSWEVRVARHGEDKARDISAPMLAALDDNKRAFAALSTFEKEHKVLLRFWECVNNLSRSKWE